MGYASSRSPGSGVREGGATRVFVLMQAHAFSATGSGSMVKALQGSQGCTVDSSSRELALHEGHDVSDSESEASDRESEKVAALPAPYTERHFVSGNANPQMDSSLSWSHQEADVRANSEHNEQQQLEIPASYGSTDDVRSPGDSAPAGAADGDCEPDSHPGRKQSAEIHQQAARASQVQDKQQTEAIMSRRRERRPWGGSQSAADVIAEAAMKLRSRPQPETALSAKSATMEAARQLHAMSSYTDPEHLQPSSPGAEGDSQQHEQNIPISAARTEGFATHWGSDQENEDVECYSLQQQRAALVDRYDSYLLL